MDADRPPSKPPRTPAIYPQDLTVEEVDQRLDEFWDPRSAEQNYQRPRTPQSRRPQPWAKLEGRKRSSLSLNRNQLMALWIGVAAEVVALAYPPWIAASDTLDGVTHRHWGWLWQRTENALASALDTPVLAVECIMIAVILVPLILSLQDPS